MKNLSRFLIPLGLGVGAFVLNWMSVQPQLGDDFVVVAADVAEHEPLAQAKLAPLKIVGQDFARLKSTFVPWSERAALTGLPAGRALKKGDFVFWQDVRYVSADFLPAADELPLHVSLEGVSYEPALLKVGNRVSFIVPALGSEREAATAATGGGVSPSGATTVGDPAAAATTAAVLAPADPDLAALAAQLRMKFEELGPFRILSVGRRTAAAPNDAEQSAAQRGNDQNVTLAVKLERPHLPGDAAVVRTMPEAARRLLAAQGVRRPDGRNIAAMVLYQDVERFRQLRASAAADPPAPAPTGR